jgi:hypothetical protein
MAGVVPRSKFEDAMGALAECISAMKRMVGEKEAMMQAIRELSESHESLERENEALRKKVQRGKKKIAALKEEHEEHSSATAETHNTTKQELAKAQAAARLLRRQVAMMHHKSSKASPPKLAPPPLPKTPLGSHTPRAADPRELHVEPSTVLPIDPPTLSKSKSVDTSETTAPVITHEMPSVPKNAAPTATVSMTERESDDGAMYEGSTSTGIAQVLDRESVENAHHLPRAELFSDVIRRHSSHNNDGDDEYDEEDVPPPPIFSPHSDHVLVAQVSEHSSTSEGNVPVASVLEAPGSRRRGSSSAPVDVTVVCVAHARKGEILTKYPSTGFLQRGSEKWVALSESSNRLEWGSVKARFTGKMSTMLSLRVAVSIFPRPPDESKKQERSRNDWHHSFVIMDSTRSYHFSCPSMMSAATWLVGLHTATERLYVEDGEAWRPPHRICRSRGQALMALLRVFLDIKAQRTHSTRAALIIDALNLTLLQKLSAMGGGEPNSRMNAILNLPAAPKDTY